MSTFEQGRVAPIISGPGSLESLPARLSACAAKSILLVSDQGMVNSGWVAKVQALLDSQLPTSVFVAPAGEPKVATVNEGAAQVRALEQPLVIGLGGGTALDIAKLIAALAVCQRPMEDYLLCANPYAGKCPSIMIPTTSGTGSEVTRTCVLSNAEGRKLWAWGEELTPDLVVLEPALTATLPAALTAATGLDAMIHALEAVTGQRSNNLVAASALQAIRQVVQALPTAVAEPGNLSARQQVQEAACLAGLAIDNAGTGIAHNIGHALGTLYHLPHGIAVTLGLQAALNWNLTGHEERYADVVRCFRADAEAREMPKLFEALLAEVNFAACLTPFLPLQLDADALLECMQASENLPMANNNVRVPSGEEWRFLAYRVVEVWQLAQRQEQAA